MIKELVDSKTVGNAYNFLNQPLRNQNKNSIITDLKSECQIAIDKLQIKQQTCTFSQKTINKQRNNRLLAKTILLKNKLKSFMIIRVYFDIIDEKFNKRI